MVADPIPANFQPTPSPEDTTTVQGTAMSFADEAQAAEEPKSQRRCGPTESVLQKRMRDADDAGHRRSKRHKKDEEPAGPGAVAGGKVPSAKEPSLVQGSKRYAAVDASELEDDAEVAPPRKKSRLSKQPMLDQRAGAPYPPAREPRLFKKYVPTIAAPEATATRATTTKSSVRKASVAAILAEKRRQVSGGNTAAQAELAKKDIRAVDFALRQPSVRPSHGLVQASSEEASPEQRRVTVAPGGSANTISGEGSSASKESVEQPVPGGRVAQLRGTTKPKGVRKMTAKVTTSTPRRSLRNRGKCVAAEGQDVKVEGEVKEEEQQ